MAKLEEFPFAKLAAEAITAEWDACHPSLCDRKTLPDGTSPETTIGRWVQLRSDSKEERAHRKAWPKKLLQYKNLKCLSVNGCTPEFFEAICELGTLLRLSVVRGRVSKLDSLARLPDLTHFYYCGSPKLANLDAIGGVKSLVGLSLIGNFESVRSLQPLEDLSEIQSLSLGANDFSQNSYESFAPVGKLKKLRHLTVFSIKVTRDGLLPIAELQNLEYLSLPTQQLRFWSIAEYKHLHRALPKLRTNLIALAATDREFQKEH